MSLTWDQYIRNHSYMYFDNDELKKKLTFRQPLKEYVCSPY